MKGVNVRGFVVSESDLGRTKTELAQAHLVQYEPLAK